MLQALLIQQPLENGIAPKLSLTILQPHVPKIKMTVNAMLLIENALLQNQQIQVHLIPVTLFIPSGLAQEKRHLIIQRIVRWRSLSLLAELPKIPVPANKMEKP